MLTDYVGVDRQKVLGKDAAMTEDAPRSADNSGGSNPTTNELLAYMEGRGDTVERIREMCNPHLERSLAPIEEIALAETQNWFDEQQKSLVAFLEAGRIDRAGFLEAINALLADMMARYSETLGKERFLRVFGEAGYEPDKLIDKAVFLGSP